MAEGNSSTGPENTESHAPDASSEVHKGAPETQSRRWMGRSKKPAFEDAEARRKRESTEDAQFRQAFKDLALRVSNSDMTSEEAAKILDMSPVMFGLLFDINARLDNYKGPHDSEEREMIVKELVERCIDDETRLQSEDLNSFINIVRPDVTEDERGEIVANLRILEASRPEGHNEQILDKERQFNEAEKEGSSVSDTRAQRAAELLDSKIREPIVDWVENKTHKFVHWLFPEGGWNEWRRRGFKFLLALLKYPIYLWAWASSVLNRMSGKGGKGH